MAERTLFGGVTQKEKTGQPLGQPPPRPRGRALRGLPWFWCFVRVGKRPKITPSVDLRGWGLQIQGHEGTDLHIWDSPTVRSDFSRPEPGTESAGGRGGRRGSRQAGDRCTAESQQRVCDLLAETGVPRPFEREVTSDHSCPRALSQARGRD